MRFILIGLVFYLLVTAYFAVQRVIRKRQLKKSFEQTSSGQMSPDQTSSGQNNAAQNFSQASSSDQLAAGISAADISDSEPKTSEPTAPDLSAPAIVTVESSDRTEDQTDAALLTAPAIEPSVSESAKSGSANVEETAAEAIDSTSPLPMGSPIVFEPESDLELAVSLSVFEVANPESSGSIEVPDLIPTDPEITEVLNANHESEQPTYRPSILEEIAELRPMADAGQPQIEDPMRRFMHLLQTGDGTARVAAVFELGEIAAQRRGSETETIIEQLQLLTQDDDPDVRLQAIAALEKVQR